MPNLESFYEISTPETTQTTQIEQPQLTTRRKLPSNPYLEASIALAVTCLAIAFINKFHKKPEDFIKPPPNNDNPTRFHP